MAPVSEQECNRRCREKTAFQMFDARSDKDLPPWHTCHAVIVDCNVESVWFSKDRAEARATVVNGVVETFTR